MYYNTTIQVKFIVPSAHLNGVQRIHPHLGYIYFFFHRTQRMNHYGLNNDKNPPKRLMDCEKN